MRAIKNMSLPSRLLTVLCAIALAATGFVLAAMDSVSCAYAAGVPTRTCPSCDGDSGGYSTCSICKGSGYSSYLDGKPYEKCTKCNGNGQIYNSCSMCHETGEVTGYFVTYVKTVMKKNAYGVAQPTQTSEMKVVTAKTLQLPKGSDFDYRFSNAKFLYWTTKKGSCLIYSAGDVVEVSSDITFYEVRANACESCEGKGIKSTTLSCGTCGGDGRIEGTGTCIYGANGTAPKIIKVECPTCTSPWIALNPGATCPTCFGHKYITKTTDVYCELCLGTGKVQTSTICTKCDNGSTVYTRTCKSCNGDGIKELPTLKHNVVIDAQEKSATCTESGNTQGSSCSDCGKALVSSEYIPSLGHQLKTTYAVQPSCTTPGVSMGKSCTRCDYTEGFEPIDARGHNLVNKKGTEASCTEGGTTDGMACTRCSYVEGIEQTAPLGHDFQYVTAKQPTCIEYGATAGYRCNRCGYQEGITFLPFVDHSMKVTKNAVPATCENSGWTAEKKCEMCSYVEVSCFLPAKGHECDYLSEIPATCLSQGTAEGLQCRVCNHIEGRQPIAALGHDFENIAEELPTCTEEGHGRGKICTRCDYTSGFNRISATGHSWRNPTWAWNNKCDYATASFECWSNSEHVDVIDAKISDESDVHGLKRTASVIHDGRTYSTTIYVADSPSDNTYTIDLPSGDTQVMYRLYNPNSGEHFYTSDTAERNQLASLGWNDEGRGWTAPREGKAVYRLYNSSGGEHHYTTNENEKNALVNVGWKDEGVGWFSDPAETVALFRLYNPNAFANNHHYTTDESEKRLLLSIGWKDEGIGWHGLN